MLRLCSDLLIKVILEVKACRASHIAIESIGRKHLPVICYLKFAPPTQKCMLLITVKVSKQLNTSIIKTLCISSVKQTEILVDPQHTPVKRT